MAKKGIGMFEVTMGAIVVIALLFVSGFIPMPEGLTVTPTPTPDVVGVDGVCDVKGIDALNVSLRTWKTNSKTTALGLAEFYEPGTDVDGPYAVPVDYCSYTAGNAFTRNGTLSQCTEYDIYYNGGSVDYDFKSDLHYLPYVDTTDSNIATANFIFDKKASPYSTIVDPLEEATEGTNVNGQSNTSGNESSGLGLVVEIGSDDTPADGDQIFYNKTNAGGTGGIFYVIAKIGADGGSTRLKNPVMCFVNPMANKMEGGEITDVSVEHRSGTDLHIPSDITSDYTGFNCVPIYEYQEDGDNYIDGGKEGTYKIAFTVAHSLADAGTDTFYVIFDDCGGHNALDIIGEHSKATATQMYFGIRAA